MAEGGWDLNLSESEEEGGPDGVNKESEDFANLFGGVNGKY